jgi:hypothetical protein
MIRALNLEDQSERIIVKVDNDQLGLVNSFNFAAEGDDLYWDMLSVSSGHQEDRISMTDLDTGRTTVLNDVRVNGWIWSILRVSGGRLVVEQDFDEEHGGGTNIFLLDPRGGQPQPLSTDGNSDMPLFVDPWVVWKAGPRYQSAQKIGVHNLQSGEDRSIPLAGRSDDDPQMDGARVYWSGATDVSGSFYAIYILDLTKNVIYAMPSPVENVLFGPLAIHGGTIAWVRTVEPSNAPKADYLEWTTIK